MRTLRKNTTIASRRFERRLQLVEPQADTPPLESSQEIMYAVNNLSPAWRRLVYEFGFSIVQAMHDEMETKDSRAARVMLNVWRQRRQEQWLSTDYLKPKLRIVK